MCWVLPLLLSLHCGSRRKRRDFPKELLREEKRREEKVMMMTDASETVSAKWEKRRRRRKKRQKRKAGLHSSQEWRRKPLSERRGEKRRTDLGRRRDTEFQYFSSSSAQHPSREHSFLHFTYYERLPSNACLPCDTRTSPHPLLVVTTTKPISQPGEGLSHPILICPSFPDSPLPLFGKPPSFPPASLAHSLLPPNGEWRRCLPMGEESHAPSPPLPSLSSFSLLIKASEGTLGLSTCIPH